MHRAKSKAHRAKRIEQRKGIKSATYKLSIINYLLPTAHCFLLSAFCFLPSANGLPGNREVTDQPFHLSSCILSFLSSYTRQDGFTGLVYQTGGQTGFLISAFCRTDECG
jgi:hypothetical protein